MPKGSGLIGKQVIAFDAREECEQIQRLLFDDRIKADLGQPVSRVILDPQDNVVLNVGEASTHQAIEQAERVACSTFC